MMPHTHNRLTTAILSTALAFATAASAQNYPSKPVRYLVPSSIGSGNDFIARIIATDISPALGQQVIVDNRAGAGGNIGAEIAARAPADGYTIMQVSSTLAINHVIMRGLQWDLMRDFAPVILLARQPNLFAVNATLPVHSIADLIKFAKAKPGTLNFASSGPGSNSFLAGELFNTLAGVKMVHVPYKGGGPAMAATAAGETSLMIGPPATAMPFIQQGRLRGIGISSKQRVAEFPQWPAVAETVSGYEFVGWYGLLVPAGTPKQATDFLRRTIAETLAKPNILKQLNSGGLFPPPADQPVDFGQFMRSEIAMLRKIVQQTGSAEK